MSNGKEMFINGVSALLQEWVLPCVVQFLEKEKEVQVTVNELIDALELPVSRTPSSFYGRSLENTKPRKCRTRRDKEILNEDQKCIYIFTRGSRAGMVCGNKTDINSKYCKMCKNKKNAQGNVEGNKALKQSSTKKKAKPGVANNEIVEGFVSTDTNENEQQFTIVQYGEKSLHLFYIPTLKLVMHAEVSDEDEIDENTSVFLAHLEDPSTQDFEELTEEDVEKLKELQLEYDKNGLDRLRKLLTN